MVGWEKFCLKPSVGAKVGYFGKFNFIQLPCYASLWNEMDNSQHWFAIGFARKLRGTLNRGMKVSAYVIKS
ncbi:MAG: hypothetical protein ACTS6P_01050 [Candidatus Hodgkinia cicadicola]